MNILFFSSTLSGGGAERVLVNITNELAKRGHHVTIAINSNKMGYEIDPSICIMPAPQKQWYQGRNLIRRLFRNFAMARIYRAHTKKAIQTVRPDVIVTFLFCNMWSIIRYHGSIPIVHSEHNAYDRIVELQYKFKRFVLNRFFDRVFVLTPFDQGYAKAKGLKNTIVMSNPNTYSTISVEDYHALFPSRRNILMVGRVDFWNVKGMDIAIEVFSNIADNIQGVDLDIVGPGSNHSIEYLKHLAVQKGVGERVHFLGYSHDVKNIMRQHKIFLLSSRTEGFPMVVTEAMTQGLPCVSFERLASAIILNGMDGVLVNDGDLKSLEHAIVDLLKDDEKRNSMGLAGLINVRRFSAERIAIRWEDSLRTLIASR